MTRPRPEPDAEGRTPACSEASCGGRDPTFGHAPPSTRARRGRGTPADAEGSRDKRALTAGHDAGRPIPACSEATRGKQALTSGHAPPSTRAPRGRGTPADAEGSRDKRALTAGPDAGRPIPACSEATRGKQALTSGHAPPS